MTVFIVMRCRFGLCAKGDEDQDSVECVHATLEGAEAEVARLKSTHDPKRFNKTGFGGGIPPGFSRGEG